LQERDFISLTDVCQVTERLVVRHTKLKQSHVFNVGAGESHSVLKMALLIQQRSSKVLGFEPELLYKKTELNELHPKLIYKTDKLRSLGIDTESGDNMTEIDRLLQFCQSTFNK
jgi:UDP-glucose 4-epimerase